MREDLQSVTWLSHSIEDDRRREAESDNPQIVIIDDMPVPADFKLSPEEYKRLYEERQRNGGEIPETPVETTETATTKKVYSPLPTGWLSGSIDPNQEREELGGTITVKTERPARDFEIDPEEYKRIKEELENEREHISGYYHEPEHFYSIGEEEDYEEKLADSYCS